MMSEFAKHAAAAEALYSDIYATVEDVGVDLPAGCTPLQAVKLLAETLRRTSSNGAMRRKPEVEIVTLAQRLQRMLADRGFNISEAAKLAGMEKQQTWRIVKGDNDNPGIKTLERIVAAVGGTMQELFADDN